MKGEESGVPPSKRMKTGGDHPLLNSYDPQSGVFYHIMFLEYLSLTHYLGLASHQGACKSGSHQWEGGARRELLFQRTTCHLFLNKKKNIMRKTGPTVTIFQYQPGNCSP